MQFFLGHFAPAANAELQFIQTGRKDEDVDERLMDFGIGGSAELSGALDVQVHDHVPAFPKLVQHGGLEGAITVF